MKQLTAALAFMAYYGILIKVMVLKDVPTIHIGHLVFNFGGTNSESPANFVPFATIKRYLFAEQGQVVAGVNLLGNIGLLVPIGLLLPLIFSKITWFEALILAVLAGLSLELMQIILDVGIFDIDDVILNALGVMIGYWIYKLFSSADQ